MGPGSKDPKPRAPENDQKSSPFEPRDRTQIKQPIHLPDELWLTILECPCTFPPEIFNTVMLNLIKNPNVTSSHLFRADIFYDSDHDHCDRQTIERTQDDFIKHMKTEYQPRKMQWPDFDLTRTIVRKLIPRNFQLDRPLVQTCHYFQNQSEDEEQTLVVYSPHVDQAADMPFYHPAVSQLAFLHTWNSTSGTLTLLYRPFPSEPISTKLERTALKLLQTIHKHGQGQLAGYEKRVNLDQIIPQKRYQDTYAKLKAKYGRQLSEQWVEVTDPGKHVFEDIGIAAYLIELWKDKYQLPGAATVEEGKIPFPGFVDIGCGNGVLTYLLLTEGYPGYGFDARNRKTWTIFPDSVQKQLQQRILVPRVLQEAVEVPDNEVWTDGIFERGTLIISNHADELTAWTPLLAYLNESDFIAIPCCSHDLAGARFRAPLKTKSAKEAAARLPQQNGQNGGSDGHGGRQAAETGSLARTEAQKKMPSAYSTLCSYVASLAEEVGFRPEQDTLRIPSTRNACIVGRERVSTSEREDEKASKVVDILETELKRDVSVVAADWIERAEKLLKKPSSGH